MAKPDCFRKNTAVLFSSFISLQWVFEHMNGFLAYVDAMGYFFRYPFLFSGTEERMEGRRVALAIATPQVNRKPGPECAFRSPVTD